MHTAVMGLLIVAMIKQWRRSVSGLYPILKVMFAVSDPLIGGAFTTNDFRR